MNFFSFLTMSMLLLSACQRENVALNLRRETSEKIMGKWMMGRTIYEVTINKVHGNKIYHPLPLLNSKIEALGTANDYFDFQANELVGIKTTYSNKLKHYKVSNPSRVTVGEVSWGIEKLTAAELVLKLDQNDAAQYRSITRVYLSRRP